MGHDTCFNNHHWGKGGGKVTFEFDAAGIDLDKIAASGQCFRWTPAPGVPGGYIVPTAGLCGTVYTITRFMCRGFMQLSRAQYHNCRRAIF